MKRRLDVLVLGAGAVGVAAARELSQEGLTALIVEARDRIGGRIWTVQDSNAPLPIELGAEFVHGEAPETFAIIRAARLLTDELPDVHYQSRNGKLRLLRDYWGHMLDVRKDMAKKLRKQSRDLSVSEYLDSAKLPSDLRKMVTNFVQGYHARALIE